MSTTGRSLLGGALAAPFLAHFTGTASGLAPDATWGSVSKAWVEIRWTPQVQAQLDRLQVTVAAVAPATLVEDGAGLRFPVRGSARSLPRSCRRPSISSTSCASS